MIVYDHHQDTTLRAGKREQRTKHNTWTEHRTQHNSARTPNPEHPEHKPEHVQNPNAEQNNEHEHVFPEPRTLFIASPDIYT